MGFLSQHISSTQKGHSFSPPKIPQFLTKITSVQLRVVLNWGFLVWNWGVCWTEGLLVSNWGVCGNEGFLVWNRGFFGVELRDFVGWKELALLCGTGLLNWGVPDFYIFSIPTYFKALLQKRLKLRRQQESNSPITQIIFWHFKERKWFCAVFDSCIYLFYFLSLVYFMVVYWQKN